MEIDRRAFIASLGGAAAVSLMDSRSQGRRARALHRRSSTSRSPQRQGGSPRSSRPWPSSKRRSKRATSGAAPATSSRRIRRQRQAAREDAEEADAAGLLPAAFPAANHVLQSATRAMKTGMSEEIILACLLHDVVHVADQARPRLVGRAALRALHPGEDRRSRSAITRRCASTPTPKPATSIPDLYHRIFGVDYTPPPHIEATYKMIRNHKWYMEPRLVTVNDLYAFDPNASRRSIRSSTSSAATSSSRRKGSATTTARARTCGGRIANPDQPL